jgi:hypothetical protein
MLGTTNRVEVSQLRDRDASMIAESVRSSKVAFAA